MIQVFEGDGVERIPPVQRFINATSLIEAHAGPLYRIYLVHDAKTIQPEYDADLVWLSKHVDQHVHLDLPPREDGLRRAIIGVLHSVKSLGAEDKIGANDNNFQYSYQTLITVTLDVPK